MSYRYGENYSNKLLDLFKGAKVINMNMHYNKPDWVERDVDLCKYIIHSQKSQWLLLFLFVCSSFVYLIIYWGFGLYSLNKKARTYKNLQLYSWFILELKMLEKQNLYLNHPGMSLHTNFKILGRLPEFLMPKMTSRQLFSETNSTSLTTGFLCTKKIKSSTDKFDPKSLLNLNKFSTIRRTFSRAFLSY